MIIAFVPVIHQGYFDFFQSYPNESIGVLGSDIIARFPSLVRDCRTINPGIIKRTLALLFPEREITVLSFSDLENLPKDTRIVLPDDDVSHELAERLTWQCTTFHSIFLRWDKMPATKESTVNAHRVITRDSFAREMITKANIEAQKSSDWWRQIGTIMIRDGKIIAEGHNHHLPTDYHLSLFGDPRTNFNAGERIDLTTAIHSEATVVAACAKKGIALEGASAFVSTFPCPNCAKLLAEAGITTVYYEKGYSLLDAEQVLNTFNVAIVRVESPNTTD